MGEAGKAGSMMGDQLLLAEAIEAETDNSCTSASSTAPDFNILSKSLKEQTAFLTSSSNLCFPLIPPTAASPLPANEIFAPRRLQARWQEMIGSAAAPRSSRNAVPPSKSSPQDKAKEMIERLKEARKAEIKAWIEELNSQISQCDKDIAAAPSADEAKLQEWADSSINHHLLQHLKLAQQAKPEAGVAKEETKAGLAGKDEAAASKSKGSKQLLEDGAGAVEEEEAEAEELPIAVVKKRNEGMQKIWKLINAHDKAEPFKKPVTKREAPDYHTVIKKPMALNDVKKKMDKSEYEGNVKEFSADMHLIFSNAMLYNQKGSDIFSWAKELKDLLKKEETTTFGDALNETPTRSRPAASNPMARKVSESNLSANTPVSVDDDDDEARGKGQSGNRPRGRKADAEEEEEDSNAGRNRQKPLPAPHSPMSQALSSAPYQPGSVSKKISASCLAP